MLGGPERRTLFICTAGSSDPNEARAGSNGKIEIIGVILAAGKGTRMEPFSSNYPKPILPICNKPLLVYQNSEPKARVGSSDE